jgi:hypothetical protein
MSVSKSFCKRTSLMLDVQLFENSSWCNKVKVWCFLKFESTIFVLLWLILYWWSIFHNEVAGQTWTLNDKCLREQYVLLSITKCREDIEGQHWFPCLSKDLGLARGWARFKHGGMLTVDFGTPIYEFTINICTYLIF